MRIAVQVLALLLVAVALCPALAHALEFPGKRRLSKEAYLTVQPIYYPGFTSAGMSEIVGMLAVLVVTVLMPIGTAQFWLSLGALLALLAMHGLYWLLTHPVNNFWLKDVTLGAAGGRFFSVGAGDSGGEDWTVLRDRWEYSHVARAALALVSLTMLAAAIALD